MTFDLVVRQFKYTGMTKSPLFVPIVFLQGEAALPALRLLAGGHVEEALIGLREIETGDEHLRLKDFDLDRPWGSGDKTQRRGDYVIASNEKLQYASLSKNMPIA